MDEATTGRDGNAEVAGVISPYQIFLEVGHQ